MKKGKGNSTQVVPGGPQSGTRIVTGGAHTVRAGKQKQQPIRHGSSK